MGTQHDAITPEIEDWVSRQHVFFVATAPLSGDGHVNCSPKGLDTLRILGPRHVAYLDLTGSGAETIAHVRENGRIVLMFCALSGPPKIVRFHGKARVVTPADGEWADLAPRFASHPGARSIVVTEVTRVGNSCGHGVPEYEFVADRDLMEAWARRKGPDGMAQYRAEKNTRSIDGLPGLDLQP